MGSMPRSTPAPSATLSLPWRLAVRLRRHRQRLPVQRQLVPGVAHAARRLRLLEEGEQLADLAQAGDGFLAHAERHALGGAEEIAEHRHAVALRLLEQQRGSAAPQRAVTDLRHLQARIDGQRNTLQGAGALELLEKIAEVFVLHGGRLQLRQRPALVKRAGARAGPPPARPPTPAPTPGRIVPTVRRFALDKVAHPQLTGRMRRHFVKMHGLGNDFAIFDATETPFEPDPTTVRRLADRRLGIGCDQLLVLDAPRDPGSVAAYRIYNAAGTPAEQCGNGARCLARYVAQRWLEARPHTLQLDSPAGPCTRASKPTVKLRCRWPCRTSNRRPSRSSRPARARDYTLNVDGERVSFGAVSMGNPHAVLRVSSVDAAPVGRIGAGAATPPEFSRWRKRGFHANSEPVRDPTARVRAWRRRDTRVRHRRVRRARGRARPVVAPEFVAVHLPGGRLMVSW